MLPLSNDEQARSPRPTEVTYHIYISARAGIARKPEAFLSPVRSWAFYIHFGGDPTLSGLRYAFNSLTVLFLAEERAPTPANQPAEKMD